MSRTQPTGSIRIIGGQWRGRKLNVPAVAGLRPTADRMRETLFNWLMPILPGAQVLDAFAGTGALGLEALSRGAAHCTFIERDRELGAALQQMVGTLQAPAQVVQADALGWLATSPAATFDLVFIDPPFAANLLPQVLPLIPRVLAPNAYVYVETAPDTLLTTPTDWLLHRELKTAHAHGRLYRA